MHLDVDYLRNLYDSAVKVLNMYVYANVHVSYIVNVGAQCSQVKFAL